MPRLDNTSPPVYEFYGIEPNLEDPGTMPIVDLCLYCSWEWEDEDQDFVIDHPPYEEQHPSYHCFDCGEVLTEADNGYD